MQSCIHDFLCGAKRKRGPGKFVDLFCGIGGASTGAVAAGYEVVLAVDSWDEGIAAHARNHCKTVHLCLKLPSTRPLPLPSEGEHWHLHGSPPCTKLSIANQERVTHDRDEALDLVRWYLDFALASTATTWSMEQVATPKVIALLESYRALGAPHRTRIAFDVFDFYEHGVPQHRRRLIAGSPELVARLRRAPRVHRCVRDVIRNPRGTHVRHYMRYANPRVVGVVDGKTKYSYSYYGDDDCCYPVTGPSHVIIAGHALRWAWPGTGKKFELFLPEEAAALQCFPTGYALPVNPRQAMRGVGNALPPVIMTQLLMEKARDVSPSLRRLPGPIGSLSSY